LAVLYSQMMPEGVPIEMLDEVTSEMDAESNPPPGLIVHVHFVQDGRARIVDVWESTDAYEAFSRDRLGPVMLRVADGRGMTLDGPGPETSVSEVRGLVRG